ncbi:bifunctional ADP-dependent NAD(P)H-hydrate dehydratase/NAD(P)H-hydrate epimerase [Janibacter sp. GXQ6167]|uniref:bifunctional ADP-dependent NAD(P)H-hydrate dehydratase/NAD(P)H-hydrate epimerase n=1 Tax=Janibacter sp. GXQ6167 TaxID=3240791 RepID=UPI003524C1DF
MILAYSPEQIRNAEQARAEELASGELMQRAAKGVAKVAAARLAERGGERITALIGPGNNGADALWAIARLAKKGVSVAAVCHDPEASPAQAAAKKKALARGAIVVLGDDPAAEELIAAADVVLDGILGIGGRAGLPQFAAGWLAAIDEGAYVIAVDLPSGQDPNGRELVADGVFADETVTFAELKPVHLLPPTASACGLLTVVDIGLDLRAEEPVVARLTRSDVPAMWPMPGSADDKYSRGVLGIVAGGERYTGAPLLTVTAAVASGAGMVRYVGTPTPEALVRSVVPEAVFGDGHVQAWVIGPGLDVKSRAKGAQAQIAVAHAALVSELPCVVDAGGLDLIDGPRDGATLLTPHAGECARLISRLSSTDVTAAEVQADPLRYAQQLAELTGASVLLKGSTTLVTGAEAVFSQADAPAWLATAGSGDVLAGVIGVLAASGLPLDVAGALGALVHGVAASDANPGGPVRARAVADQLPLTIAHLLTAKR